MSTNYLPPHFGQHAFDAFVTGERRTAGLRASSVDVPSAKTDRQAGKQCAPDLARKRFEPSCSRCCHPSPTGSVQAVAVHVNSRLPLILMLVRVTSHSPSHLLEAFPPASQSLSSVPTELAQALLDYTNTTMPTEGIAYVFAFCFPDVSLSHSSAILPESVVMTERLLAGLGQQLRPTSPAGLRSSARLASVSLCSASYDSIQTTQACRSKALQPSRT